MHSDDANWTLDRHLLAAIYDAVSVANWQRGSGKKKDRPKPLPRPGSDKGTRIGDSSRLTPAEARALLDALKPKGVTPSP